MDRINVPCPKCKTDIIVHFDDACDSYCYWPYCSSEGDTDSCCDCNCESDCEYQDCESCSDCDCECERGSESESEGSASGSECECEYQDGGSSCESECACEDCSGNSSEEEYSTSDNMGACSCECSRCCEGWYAVEPTSGRGQSAEDNLTKRFATHDVKCYYCRGRTIEGIRWVYKRNERYSACSRCVPSTASWRAVRFPWSELVPEAPLSERDPNFSQRTVHLQKVLTELGFMSLADTNKYTGYFQHRTGNGVEAFRRAYGLTKGNMRKYDRRTQRKLEQVFCYYAK